MTETSDAETTPTPDQPPSWKEGDLCSWRRRSEKSWTRGHVLRVLNDKDGSIRVFDKRNPQFPACVPDDPACIRRRR